ncbi:SIR2 family protein [Naasia sp. SYSU D00948]|uniref:SIR2 family NAD-dependent protein deacylase n=1 Tax=Naasia sp. SYSU D00948 TaxID=2817379 RepID=UPI001B310A0E|nr:SIR2 family protein [Naasia sp. SYSU D00948]
MSAATSHLFVVRGNIAHLACDAWLLPTDARARITEAWRTVLPDLRERLDRSELDDLTGGRSLVAELAGDEERPAPVLTAGPLEALRSPDELRPAVRAFLELGARIAERKRAKDLGTARFRPVPLLAMPFFGSRGGGGRLAQGSLLTTLLDEATGTAARLGVDVVLVLSDEPAYALAQQLRRSRPGSWSCLAPGLLDEAERLAAEARAGRLVPFMGAGVSVTGGAPNWPGLIERLADAVALSDAERESLLNGRRDARDQAAFLRAAFLRSPVTDDPDGGFASAIIDIVDVRRYGLAPALLASLRAEQAITLNYDQLFERAAEDAGLPRSVLPGDGRPSARWLLKLHGTVTDRDSIVLTRDDYIGFHAERAAYSALVAASMMTRHLLFVGFGLADDHFHEIVHDVRRAAGAPGVMTIGTVLTLRDDPLEMTIWREDLAFVRTETEGEDRPGSSSRALEVFLDAMMALATDRHPYLLAEGFEDGLDEDELVLREELIGLGRRIEDRARRTSSWIHVERTLRDLGFGHGAD